jgi:hypothetical protein
VSSEFPPSSRQSFRSKIPLVILVVLVLASGGVAWSSSRPHPVVLGPEGVAIVNAPDLAPASTSLTGGSVDAITCRNVNTATVKYHIHVHLAIYVSGHEQRVPAGVGITSPAIVQHLATGTFIDAGASDCLYWLHTHVADGIIHVEAPSRQAFTLGEFFDVWHQPLTAQQVGPAKGALVVYLNGRRWTQNPRLIPLLAQEQIQIDVGSPAIPFQPSPFKVTGSCGEGTTSCALPTG